MPKSNEIAHRVTAEFTLREPPTREDIVYFCTLAQQTEVTIQKSAHEEGGWFFLVHFTIDATEQDPNEEFLMGLGYDCFRERGWALNDILEG